MLQNDGFTKCSVPLLILQIILQEAIGVSLPLGCIPNVEDQTVLAAAWLEVILCDCCKVCWSGLSSPLWVSFHQVLLQISSIHS